MAERENIYHSPLRELRKFTTRVWEHPLLDEQTKAHRARAKTHLANYLTAEGFSSDTFVAIPVGSTLWAADEKSDYDYVLTMKDADIAKTADEGPLRNYDILEEDLHIDVCGSALGPADLLQYTSYGASLLFTPDEYISGNLALARQLRLGFVNRLARLYINKLADVDLTVLEKIVEKSFAYAKEKHRSSN